MQKFTCHTFQFENESQIRDALNILDHYKIKARIFQRDSDTVCMIKMIDADEVTANYVIETMRAIRGIRTSNNVIRS